MQFSRSPDARPVDSDWHRGRQAARETAYNGNLDLFFSDEEQIRYELDTAQITGASNPQTYTVNRPIDLLGTNGLDLRELFNR